MQAASALSANAITAPGGDGAGAPNASDASGRDAFTSALAALMGVLGPAQVASDPSAPAAAGGATGQDAAAAAFQPTPTGAAASTGAGPAGPGSLNGAAPSVLADVLQTLDMLVTDFEAAKTAGGAAAASVGQGSANSSAPGDAAAAMAAAASPDSPEDQLLALLTGLEDQAPAGTGAAAPPAEVAGPVSAPDAPVSDPALDPRLIRFVARGETTPQSDTSASNAGSTQTDSPPATNAAPTAGDAVDGPPGLEPGASGEDAQASPTSAQANPIAAGLVVFNPSGGQAAPLSPAPVANRSTTARTATAPVAPGAVPARLASSPNLGPAALAQLGASRDDAAADAPLENADAGTSSNDGSDGSDASTGTPPPAFQLAGAPALATAVVTVPPAAAALAQAHGADITAQLAAQIAARSGAVRSSFDFSLEPLGLGRVDVALKIDAQGSLSAVLSFDNPAVAAEARSRAGDLHQALQQAGFDLSQSGLSFTAGGGQGHGAAFQSAGHPSHAAPRGGFVETAPPELAAIVPALAGRSARGLDITI